MKAAAIALTCLAHVFFFQIYPNFINPNESSRLLLAAALADDHTAQIDKALQRYGDTRDKSVYHGRLYAAKPPGYSFLAVPFYLLVTRLSGVQDTSTIIWFLRFFLNLIPLLFFTIFMVRYFEQKLGIGRKAYLVVTAFLFGTLYYPYAQLFMSHVTTGMLWLVAFYFVTEHTNPRHGFIAGAILGFCFEMEVLSFIPIFFCGLYLLFERRQMMATFAFGAFLFALPSFLYNALVFGGPFQWPYLHTYDPQFQAQNQAGYVGIHLPSLRILWQLAFGTYRGMFYHTPQLIFGAAGLLCANHKRGQALTAFGIVLGNFLFVSGMHAWEGGWSFGPRYLVPVIPFLAYGSALWLHQLARMASAQKPVLQTASRILLYFYLVACALTIPLVLFGAVTWPFPPMYLANTLVWENFTFFWRGFFGLNLGESLGLGDSWIRLIAIGLVVVPALYFVWRAELGRKPFLAFAFVLLLAFPASRLLQKHLEDRTDAQHCFAIGRSGYNQANYGLALEFLRYANLREPDPLLKSEIDRYIGLTLARLGDNPQP